MYEKFYRVATKAGKGRYIVNDVEFDELVDGLNKLRSKQEIKTLLMDLLTVRETAEIIRRWLVGRMLMNGLTYEEIIDRTGMASETIAMISSQLIRGTGMLFKILERTPHKTTDKERAAARKRKYEIDRARSPVDRKFHRMIHPFDHP